MNFLDQHQPSNAQARLAEPRLTDFNPPIQTRVYKCLTNDETLKTGFTTYLTPQLEADATQEGPSVIHLTLTKLLLAPGFFGSGKGELILTLNIMLPDMYACMCGLSFNFQVDLS